jgi:hypothetical protein
MHLVLLWTKVKSVMEVIVNIATKEDGLELRH